ncbi:Oxysterol-binding protein-related protein 8 [Anabarilius grahami]|uniref:Oxysterol-binding protein-related protein 8 n=1 Tax=Anabarilius grahami TaxID=495550 RepID=A0A3N0Z1Z3_ANAGA|nr:Oxysterol-binding protein-related protein 8 [Anabarilius grahami]
MGKGTWREVIFRCLLCAYPQQMATAKLKTTLTPTTDPKPMPAVELELEAKSVPEPSVTAQSDQSKTFITTGPVQLQDTFTAGPVQHKSLITAGPAQFKDNFTAGPAQLKDLFTNGPALLKRFITTGSTEPKYLTTTAPSCLLNGLLGLSLCSISPPSLWIHLRPLLHWSRLSSPTSYLHLRLNDSMLENHMENDANSDKSERETHEDSDNAANENGGRLTEESDMDQSDDVCLQATAFVEEAYEEMGEAGEASQVETVSDENKGLIWTLLKQLRPGMDLSKVVLPTFILEPRSFLDKLSDYYYHADLLSQAVTEESPYCRMKQVLRWYLSGFYKKPKATFYISNKKDGFCISGSILAKSKFYGNSLSAILDGKARLLLLPRDEEYIITMPYAHCKGILYGTMTLELGGKITIECEKTQCYTELEFKLKPFLGSSCNVNQISGKIRMGEDVLGTVDGHWDSKVHLTEKKTGHQEVLWNPSPDIRRQRLKRQVVQMDQQEAFESQRLWQHVTRAITDKDQNSATQEKFVLEEAQRQEARERGERPWSPRLFTLNTDTNEWHYKYADTKPWDPDRCLVQFEKDGIIQTKEKSQRQRNSFSYSQNWAGQQKLRVNGKHRKSSSQPSSCSQNTESSSTTPEPNHESSDNEGKNLSALGRQIARHKTSEESKSLSGRHFLILCMLLLFQLLINYVFT